ncbi:unnamed protein product, partial [Prorocentrum cordatum]
MLSRAGRHLEAQMAVKDAQRCLSGVLAWAEDCGPGDPGVDPIAEEARALRCAAVLAEAIEMEQLLAQAPNPAQQGAYDQPPRQEDAASACLQAYAWASELAAEQLPKTHPVAAVAQRLHRLSAKVNQQTVLPPLDKSGARGREAGMAGSQTGVYPRVAVAQQDQQGSSAPPAEPAPTFARSHGRESPGGGQDGPAPADAAKEP